MPVKDSPSSSRSSASPSPSASSRSQASSRANEGKNPPAPTSSPSGNPSREAQRPSRSTSNDAVSVSSEARSPAEDASSIDSLVAGLDSWNETPKEPEAGDGAEAVEATGAGVEEGTAESAQPEGSELNLEEGELLGQGRDANPEQVTQLQEMLAERGVEVEADGVFGPRTAEAVRTFQTENELTVDGIVGPQTMAALNSAEVGSGSGEEIEEVSETGAPEEQAPTIPGELGQISLADPNLSPAEQYDHYRELVEANGGQINADGATVLGMRGLGTDGERHDGTSNIGGYDDTFVVLNHDANGQPTVETFGGATHANQRSSGASYGPDRDGNTIAGVAMLAPGNYNVNAHSRNYQGNRGPSFHVQTLDGSGMVPAFRDTDADGTISAQERAQAERGAYEASAILFHAGGSSAPSSIGCQTLPPDLIQAFSDAVGFQQFNYTLLDANSSRLPE